MQKEKEIKSQRHKPNSSDGYTPGSKGIFSTEIDYDELEASLYGPHRDDSTALQSSYESADSTLALEPNKEGVMPKQKKRYEPNTTCPLPVVMREYLAPQLLPPPHHQIIQGLLQNCYLLPHKKNKQNPCRPSLKQKSELQLCHARQQVVFASHLHETSRGISFEKEKLLDLFSN